MKDVIKKHPYLFLTVISLFLYLIGNDLLAVTDTAESNYALTAKEMVLSGDWISPQIYGRYWYDKPIFYYWELALSFSLFGFNEFAARFPSAVLSVLNILFTFWFVRKVFDEKTAWLSALILGTSMEFFLLSKAVITDATLFLFMSAAVAFFYLGYRENRAYYYLCYIFTALATLTKGPVGIVLPGLAAVIFLFYAKDIKELLHVHLFSGMLLFLLIAGSWYGTMTYLHGYDFLLNFIGVHNILRATVSEHPAQNTWYFYILIYFIGFLPWSFALPVTLFKKRKELHFREASPVIQLLIMYAVVVFVFFQMVATKYTTYTFPALFSLSILTAYLYKDISFRIEKTSLVTFGAYMIISLFIAPPIMLNHSGKEIGLALSKIDTTDTTICFEDFYRTSAVFYSGKTIYSAVPGDKIDSMKPSGMSWNAKNVMPFISIEEARNLPRAIIITKKDSNKSSRKNIAEFPYDSTGSTIEIAGGYTLYIHQSENFM